MNTNTKSFAWNQCGHKATPIIHFDGGATLVCGNADNLSRIGDLDLIIACEGMPGSYSADFKPAIRVESRALALLGEMPDSLKGAIHPVPVLGIDWPDYGLPRLSRAQWHGIADTLRGMPGKRVGVCCQGGHGRTGTAVSILAGISGVVSKDKCPIAWTREMYCAECVESAVQVSYVARMTGCNVTSLSSDAIYAARKKPVTYAGAYNPDAYDSNLKTYPSHWNTYQDTKDEKESDNIKRANDAVLSEQDRLNRMSRRQLKRFKKKQGESFAGWRKVNGVWEKKT